MDPATSCLQLRLRVPRSPARVASVRRLLTHALTAIGVVPGCRDDVVLAVNEACSNVVDHAPAVYEYDVAVTVDATWCVAEVFDCGPGMTEPWRDRHRGPRALRGRGLHLIRVVTDNVELRAVHPHGLAIRMTKRLSWEGEMPAGWTADAYEHWTVLDNRTPRTNGSAAAHPDGQTVTFL